MVLSNSALVASARPPAFDGNTRQGQDYLSVKMPGATKAMRLRGPLFEAGTDYRSLAPPKSGKPGTIMLTVPEYQKALASWTPWSASGEPSTSGCT